MLRMVTRCRACGWEVAWTADRCPNCRAWWPWMKTWSFLLAVTIILAALLAILTKLKA